MDHLSVTSLGPGGHIGRSMYPAVQITLDHPIVQGRVDKTSLAGREVVRGFDDPNVRALAEPLVAAPGVEELTLSGANIFLGYGLLYSAEEIMAAAIPVLGELGVAVPEFSAPPAYGPHAVSWRPCDHGYALHTRQLLTSTYLYTSGNPEGHRPDQPAGDAVLRACLGCRVQSYGIGHYGATISPRLGKGRTMKRKVNEFLAGACGVAPDDLEFVDLPAA